MKTNRWISTFCIGSICMTCGIGNLAGAETPVEARVDSVLRLMTLTEKIGQMNQISNTEELTGQQIEYFDTKELIKGGHVGSMLNVSGA